MFDEWNTKCQLLIPNYQLSNWLGYKYKVNLLEFVMIITNNCENEKRRYELFF
jgi:hypothetical protein